MAAGVGVRGGGGRGERGGGGRDAMAWLVGVMFCTMLCMRVEVFVAAVAGGAGCALQVGKLAGYECMPAEKMRQQFSNDFIPSAE